jgi:DNA transposition AAA+ family ATPase
VSEVRAEIKAYMKSEGLSQRHLSRALGIPVPTLNRWLLGKYKHNLPRIENAVKAFLALRKEMESAPKRDTEFIMTSAAGRLFDTARFCHLSREIGVCCGVAGVGKTEAVKQYARENPDVILVEVDLSVTVRALFQELHRKVGLGGFGTVHDMFKDVVEKLDGSGRLILVDEAEYLPFRALELLRRIHDKAGIGLLLVGLPRLISNLRGYRGEYVQLYSRVAIANKIDPLRPVDTEMIIQSVVPQANGLSAVYHEVSRGNARMLSKVIAQSLRLAELNEMELTPELIRETAKMLII